MENLFYHYDSFELFGKKFHRVILLPEETSYNELNKIVKSAGVKSDGFFWKKLFMYSVSKNPEKYDGEFDFDAEKEATIICHESKDELLKLCKDTFHMIDNPDSFSAIITEVKDLPLNPYEDDVDDFQ